MGTVNQDRNKIWTEKFNEAYKSQNCANFLQYINEKTRLKPLYDTKVQNYLVSKDIQYDHQNKNFPIQSISINSETQDENISMIADKTAHIQVHTQSLGSLFISREELQNNTNLQEVDKDIIANGARGFDPFDQEDWPKVIGTQWPTAKETRDPNGVAKLGIDVTQKGIFLDTNPKITKAYGTRPRAIGLLDEKNNSIILAFQQENHNPDIDFAAWSVLPFKIRENKKTFAIFPSDKKTIKKFKEKSDNSMAEIFQSAQWDIEKNKFFVVDVSKPSSKTEYIDSYADWCVFASQDDETICLVRSGYKDKTDSKQFKVFSGQEDLGGTKYVELEFIAPKVPENEKSTLVYRIDFIHIKQLGIKSLDTENMEANIRKIGEQIESRTIWAKTLSVLSFSYRT